MDAERDATRQPEERSRRLFNHLAPCYPLLHRALLPRYRRALARLALPPELAVLDVGTGTGALAEAFLERGHSVTGVDVAERLLARACRRLPAGRFERMDIAALPALAAASFGIVAMAYVLHGLSPALRTLALAEACRLASHHVLVIDYAGPGPWYVRLVETVEGPHYRSFVATPVEALLAAHGLQVVHRLQPAPFSACWLCTQTGRDGQPGTGAPLRR